MREETINLVLEGIRWCRKATAPGADPRLKALAEWFQDDLKSSLLAWATHDSPEHAIRQCPTCARDLTDQPAREPRIGTKTINNKRGAR